MGSRDDDFISFNEILERMLDTPESFRNTLSINVL